jgi:hypothetical protein
MCNSFINNNLECNFCRVGVNKRTEKVSFAGVNAHPETDDASGHSRRTVSC